MKFFIDTANVEDIRKANDMGVICGVTTNPSLIAKEGRDFNEVINEITSIVDGPISGEVKATTVDAEGMIREGREIAAIHPNMVVKIPMTVEGLKAVKVLSAEIFVKHIQTLQIADIVRRELKIFDVIDDLFQTTGDGIAATTWIFPVKCIKYNHVIVPGFEIALHHCYFV